MLASTNGCLCAIGMVLEEQRVHFCVRCTTIIVLPAVELFINRFQFGVEQTEHAFLKALALDHHPLLQFITWDIVHIHRALGAGVCIGTARANALHHFIVLVRHSQASRHIAQAIDAVVDDITLGLIGGFASQFIGIADLLKNSTLLGPFRSTDMRGAFEEHVLQIVRKTCGIGRVVLATGTCCDIGLHTRRIGVAAQPHLQAVIKRVDARFQWVTWNGRIRVGFLRGGKSGQNEKAVDQQKAFRHVFELRDGEDAERPVKFAERETTNAGKSLHADPYRAITALRNYPVGRSHGLADPHLR